MKSDVIAAILNVSNRLDVPAQCRNNSISNNVMFNSYFYARCFEFTASSSTTSVLHLLQRWLFLKLSVTIAPIFSRSLSTPTFAYLCRYAHAWRGRGRFNLRHS